MKKDSLQSKDVYISTIWGVAHGSLSVPFRERQNLMSALFPDNRISVMNESVQQVLSEKLPGFVKEKFSEIANARSTDEAHNIYDGQEYLSVAPVKNIPNWLQNISH